MATEARQQNSRTVSFAAVFLFVWKYRRELPIRLSRIIVCVLGGGVRNSDSNCYRRLFDVQALGLVDDPVPETA